MGKIECINNEKVCIKSATKLMEQLNVHKMGCAGALNDVSIRNAIAFGDDKAGMQLAIETEDQSIFLYQPEPVDASMKCISVALKGHDIAAGLDADGRICLFAVKGDRLYHIREKAPNSGQFSNVEELSVTRPVTDSRIVALTLHQLSDDVDAPFVLAVVMNSNGKYWLDLRYCDSSESRLFPVPLTTECFMFSGDKREELKLRVIRENYGIYDVETGKTESSIPIDLDGKTAVAEAVKYVSGTTLVLYKGSDNMKIAALKDSADGGKMNICELFEAEDIHCFNAWGDEKNISVAVHTNMLCHGEATLSDGVWSAGALDPLAKSASMLSAIKYNNAMQLFYFTGTDNLLHRLEDMEGQNWNETIYEPSEPGSVTRPSCYSTELTFTDPKHKTVALTGVKVTLTAGSRTYVETAEGISMIDEKTSVTTTTDNQGKIFFRQYSSRLDVPTIYANVSGDLLGNDEQLSFSQFSDVYDRLGKVDGQTLLSAQQFDSKTSECSPLISDKYRTEENADQLAKGIQQLVGSLKRKGTGIMCLQKKGAPSGSEIQVANDLPSWRLQFLDDGSVVYEELTAQQAEERIKYLTSDGGLGLPRWLTKIGDFFRSVVKDIVKVCEVVINGIKATVKFILNGIEMVFETVLNTVQEVLKFVEIIFAPILVVFKHIFRWLASLFGWNYVLYTKKAIAGMLDLLLDWLPQNAAELNSLICGKIEIAKTSADKWIDEMIEKIKPSGGMMSYFESELPDENEQITYEMSNDPLQAAFSKALASGSNISGCICLDFEETNELKDLLTELESFIKGLSDDKAFDEAQNYFLSAFANIDNFFSFLVSGILSAIKALINLALNGCTKIVSDLFGTVSVILSKFRELITVKIYFPLLSEIYSWISGDELTLLDLTALLTALPTTVIGKLVLGSVPFSSENDSGAFVEQLKSKMRFAIDDSLVESGKITGDEESDSVETTLETIILYSAIGYGVANLVLDAKAFDDDNDNDNEWTLSQTVAIISLVLEGIWLTASLPCFYDDSTSTKDQKEYSWVMWAYFALGLFVDTLIFIVEHKHVDAEKGGRIITTIYGVGHLFYAIFGIWVGLLDVSTTCGEVFSSVIEFTKIMFNCESMKDIALTIELGGVIAIAAVNCFDS